MPSHMISRAVDSPHMMQPARYAFALDSNELLCKHKQAFNSNEKEYHAMDTTLNGPFSQSARSKTVSYTHLTLPTILLV